MSLMQMPVYATPLAADEEFVPLPVNVLGNAAAHPDKSALYTSDRTVSWGELGRDACRIANRLIEAGLEPGDTVAGLSENTPEYVALYLGVLVAGGAMVPLSSMATGETLRLMIDDCGAHWLFVSDRSRELVEPLHGSLEEITPDRIIVLDSDGENGLAQWLGDAPDHEPKVEITPEHPFNIIYSSGTTGVPKGIVHDHRMRFRHVGRFRNLGLDSDAVTLVSTPLYSNTTLVAALPTLAFGGALVLMAKFDARLFLELAERHAVTHAMMVPVQYQRILAVEDFDRFDLSSFKLKLSAGAPFRASLMQEVLDRWPGKLLEIYGVTEGGAGTMLDASRFPDKLDSVGRPSEGTDVRIIDEQGNEVPQGEIGEIVGHAGAMMRGYLNRDEQTRELLWQSPEGRNFYRTGDMGRFDADGFLYILDRRKDMILSGGFNVYAADLEQVLSQHPAVDDASVIAIPSEQWGETPLGLVVLKTGFSVTEKEILEWANDRLGKAQRLSSVEFREELPRSSIGKVLKRELRAQYWDKKIA